MVRHAARRRASTWLRVDVDLHAKLTPGGSKSNRSRQRFPISSSALLGGRPPGSGSRAFRPSCASSITAICRRQQAERTRSGRSSLGAATGNSPTLSTLKRDCRRHEPESLGQADWARTACLHGGRQAEPANVARPLHRRVAAASLAADEGLSTSLALPRQDRWTLASCIESARPIRPSHHPGDVSARQRTFSQCGVGPPGRVELRRSGHRPSMARMATRAFRLPGPLRFNR